MKLKVARIKHVNPSTKAMGYCTRVVTNGRMGFEEIAERASSNTTVHQAEMRMSLEICMETVSPVATADGLSGLRTCGWIGCARRCSTVRRASCSRRLAVPPSSGCAAGRVMRSPPAYL